MEKTAFQIACACCHMRELCMPAGLSDAELDRVDRLVSQRRAVRRGGTLFRDSDDFSALYAIRTGSFKTRMSTADGREQVTGFQMAGDIIGLDGIVCEQHSCDAIALEDADVCVLPYGRIEELAREFPPLQSHLHRIMSREIVRDQRMMMTLGGMRAEERLAVFLLDLAQRLHARGLSRCDLTLRMSREEIGSFLGITIETVSRTFSRLADEGIIHVRQRHVRILDAQALRRLSPTSAAC